MDIVTLAAAKSYTDSQRLAYSEWTDSYIKWDGNREGKQILPGSLLGVGGTFYRITEKVFSADKWRGAGVVHPNAALGEVIDVHTVAEGIAVLVYGTYNYIGGRDKLLAISLAEDLSDEIQSGTYFWWLDGNHYVNGANGFFTETVKPIDPKYLEPAMPKVIDLEYYGLAETITNLVMSGGGTSNIAPGTEHMAEFWQGVNTDQILMVESLYSTGMIYAVCSTVMREEGNVVGIAYPFIGATGGIFISATIQISRTRSYDSSGAMEYGATINVVSTMTQIPTA